MVTYMRRFFGILCCLFTVCACDKHDPVLPGVRIPIFAENKIHILNKDIHNIPKSAHTIDNSSCRYTLDSNNTVWDGDRKIFTGFPTNNTVSATRKPVCHNGHVYAGLSTGELVKINPNTRQIAWIADIYQPSNMTGGASIVDIIAPVIPFGDSVYVGGLGDAFCRIKTTSGATKWCLNIGVSVPFVIAGEHAFVVGTDNNLYAVLLSDGSVYWRSPVQEQTPPTYTPDYITVGDEKFLISNGKKILDK